MKLFKKVIYLLFLALLPAAFFFVPDFIKVRKVECVSQFGPCSNFILAKLDARKETSLKGTKKEISDFLLTQAQIEDFSLRFKIPDTILLSVLEKKARFAIYDKERNVYATVDEEGAVLAIFEETNLPYVGASPKNLNVGEKVTLQELTALNLQERVHRAYQVKGGELTQNSLTVSLPEGYNVIFPLDRDPEELMGALTLILSSLKRGEEDSRIGEETGLKTIDLRFKNPVLR